MDSSKQRRKVQNRKNQRAHRRPLPLLLPRLPVLAHRHTGTRLREKDPAYAPKPPRSFEVLRLRLDEFNDEAPSSGLSQARLPMCAAAEQPRSSSTRDSQTHLRSDSPSFVFPLSTDHLLHLIQYNVFRAFVSNKHTLKHLLTGWTRACSPADPSTCPVSGPYRDDTSVYPMNPNIPHSLSPTHLQQTCMQSIWINFFPFPRMRDNLIRREGTFDHWELLKGLIGELMSITPTQPRQDGAVTFTVNNPEPLRRVTAPAAEDDDEITTGRRGLIVWGEPHDMNNWEATPGFLAKWS
ncbi:hypothetical protein CMUS01_12812 [Colletotrichum musicola]|uniref:Uncharacterized protein n=1 Tax=Colletotrichum musicola TaxID=2175873 RepID=A0A8H6MYC2_9PEZI|nr:hypothetical protein CMUS01_12812 [Colletotrichum musicola]